jgi:hypothetical protein
MGNHQAILDAITVVTQALANDTLRVVYTPGKGRGVIAMRAFDIGDVIEVAPVLVVQNSDLIDQTELANYEPNARYEKRPEDGGFGTIRYTCIRAIAVGDEIVINYNGDPNDRSPMWFDLAPTT